MSTKQDLARARDLLSQTLKILQSEGGEQWSPGIRLILRTSDSQASADEKLLEMGRTLRGMYGPGGFGDFHIWRDDFAERKLANEEYSAVADELWELLCAASNPTLVDGDQQPDPG
jgi:hypothetical protein